MKPPATLAALRTSEAACTRCPLYKFATQVVPGEGSVHASLMLVGEQPGDQEDLAGRPFVGPAGRILDQALADSDIDRGEVFVTNAVKRPNAYEIERCKWWLEGELSLVRPRVIVALGVTAAQSLFERKVTIGAMRGQPHDLGDERTGLVTMHPSALLRIRDAADKKRQFRAFVADLRLAKSFVR